MDVRRGTEREFMFMSLPVLGMFEKSTWIRLPRNVVVGHGVVARVGEAIAETHLGGRPLVVTSPTPREVAGEQVVTQLRERGPNPELVVVEEATFDAVERVLGRVDATGTGYLVGVGGGKAIDITKMAASERKLGFVSVPTAASHDGIVSNRGSVPEGDTRHSVAARPPLAVVADTAVLADAPWRLTTAGCADIISNYTAVRDWQLAHRLQGAPYSEYAGALAEMTAELLVERSADIREGLEESAWVVLKALVSSGVAMSIAGSSRPASGAEHLFSHQLDRLVPGTALHGHQVGVGTILVAYLQDGDGRWPDIRRALNDIGAPTTAGGLGIEADTVVRALATAHEVRDRYTILGDGISEAAAREAASVTGVI
jgi:glycerol-1-phosphate dehydrogenase [NAD(P)+]